MKNKRGDASAFQVLIAIAIGLAILVFSIMALTGTLKNLLFWIPKDNIQAVSTQCSASCAQQDVYNFCSKPVELKVDAKTSYMGTCHNFATKTIGETTLSSNYGIADCSGLCPA